MTMDMTERDHLDAAETMLADAHEYESGSPEQLGLSVLALAHVMAGLLRDTLQPAQRPPAPEFPAWNVIVRVRATVNTNSAKNAISALKARLIRAGFSPMDDPGDSYHSAQPASAGTWATVISVTDVLVAETGNYARLQLCTELSRANFSYEDRVRPGDWFRSEDQ
jgi:hypothetical protein